MYYRIKEQVNRFFKTRKDRHNWKNLRRTVDYEKCTFDDLVKLGNNEFGLWQKHVEIKSLMDLFLAENPQVVGEIGVLQGGNTLLFMTYLKPVKVMIGIDLKLQNAEKLSMMAPKSVNFNLFEGDSAGISMINKVSETLGGNLFDCLFIDGDHSYQGVKRDFEAYLKLVRPGGLIAFHDIMPDEVARGLKTREQSPWNAGEVYQFWSEVKLNYEHYEFVEDRDQIGFGIGVIRLPS